MELEHYAFSEVEDEVAVVCTRFWDRRRREALIDSAIPCQDTQVVVGPYQVSNPLRLTVLTAKSADYTTAPQHLQVVDARTQNNFKTVPTSVQCETFLSANCEIS